MVAQNYARTLRKSVGRSTVHDDVFCTLMSERRTLTSANLMLSSESVSFVSECVTLMSDSVMFMSESCSFMPKNHMGAGHLLFGQDHALKKRTG